MKDEPGANLQSQQSSARTHYMTKHDVIGIVLGVPVLIAGIYLSALSLHDSELWTHDSDSQLIILQFGIVGLALLLISVGLFIPGILYQRSRARAIGLIALGSAMAATICCAGFFGFCTLGFLSDPHGDFAGLVAMIGIGGLLASAVPIFCAWVLLMKLRPTPARAAVGIAAGIAVGLLDILLVYLLYPPE